MKLFRKIHPAKSLFALYLLIWSGLNALTLLWFPRIHSDEAWLAGLSNAYLKTGSSLITEPFFDLFPRQPHAFKSLFHLLQALFIYAFDLSIGTVRLMSLFAAVYFLIMMHQFLKRSTLSHWQQLLMVVVIGIQPIFLTASHLARQEIVLFSLLPGLFILILPGTSKLLPFGLAGLLIGLSALLHPNALILGAMAGATILLNVLTKSSSVKQLFAYVTSLAGAGLSLLALSLAMSPQFIQNYFAFGSSLSVSFSLRQRLTDFCQFFRLIGNQDTGTYWLPDLRSFFTAASGLLLAGVFLIILPSFRNIKLPFAMPKTLATGVVNLLAFLFAQVLIGRFNPTSILFLFWPVILLGLSLFEGLSVLPVLKKNFFKYLPDGLLILLLIFSSTGSWQMVRPFLPMHAADLFNSSENTNPYVAYEQSIARALPDSAIVLGNLSAGFVLTNQADAFYDVRNLPFLDPDNFNESLIGYLKRHKINTVVWYEEYDYILRNPDWWVLYETRQGLTNKPVVLAELKTLLADYGTVQAQFETPFYGTRIARYQGDYPWGVKVYQLDAAKIP